MVIDFHTHAFPDAIAQKAIDGLVKASGALYPPCTDGTLGGLKRNMESFGVDLSVVQPVITKASQLKTLNEWAASICSKDIISFGAIYPHTEDYKADIDFVCSLGLKGLKFHVEYQGFSLDEPKMLKIYDYAFEKGLIVLHHAGFDPAYPPPYRSSPKQFANAYKQLGGGVMVAAHLGGERQWNDVEEYIVGTNIYLDTSMGSNYYPKEQLLRIIRNHGADKILFATDSPWSRADEEIACINSLPITDEEKEKIFSLNAKRLLG